MKASALAILTGLAACASAAPGPVPLVVYEKRSTQMQKWSRRDVRLSRDTITPISIGLTQSNLDKGYEFLMDVSHPESENFGKHWSMEKVVSPDSD
jgi:tripeptidyl-peptidase-1